MKYVIGGPRVEMFWSARRPSRMRGALATARAIGIHPRSGNIRRFCSSEGLLRVFQQAHYRRGKRSKEGHGSKWSRAISYDNCFDLELIASLNASPSRVG
jgi:hypothetical protein